MSEPLASCQFVDWLSITERYPAGGLPILIAGLSLTTDAGGVVRHERVRTAYLRGSHSSTLTLWSDGFRVALGGNVGRFGRKDNLFNYSFRETMDRANSVLAQNGFPAFGSSKRVPEPYAGTGARLLRVDATRNYGAGSDVAARAALRWFASRSVSRMRKGRVGDESAWLSNSRWSLKAYLKGEELFDHGIPAGDARVAWCRNRGVLRVELTLRRRLLADLGLTDPDDVTDEALIAAFDSQADFVKQGEIVEVDEVLALLPRAARSTFAAWYAGRDVREFVSRATLYRHAAAVRAIAPGYNIVEVRPDISVLNSRVRLIELQALSVPQWYPLRAA